MHVMAGAVSAFTVIRISRARKDVLLPVPILKERIVRRIDPELYYTESRATLWDFSNRGSLLSVLIVG